MSSAGAGGLAVTGNTGFVFMRLKPRSQRTLDANAFIQNLRPKLDAVAGIRVFLQVPPTIRMGRWSRSPGPGGCWYRIWAMDPR